VNLSEFLNIGISKNTSGYPFGGEEPTPWYYKTPQLYATGNLLFGKVGAYQSDTRFILLGFRNKLKKGGSITVDV
jgi:hypothetical protein